MIFGFFTRSERTLARARSLGRVQERGWGEWRAGVGHVEGPTTSSFAADGLSVVASCVHRLSASAAREIAESYRVHGPAAVKELPAGQSFVLVDEAQKILVAASEITSRSPLAFREGPQELLVGSRLLPLLRCQAAPPQLDESYLAFTLLGRGAFPAGITPIRGFRRLRAGEVLVVHNGRPSLQMVDEILASSARLRGPEEWVDAFWASLNAIVEPLRGNRLCLSLSGGLDSTVIGSAMASRGSEVDAFSIVASSYASLDESREIASFERAFPRARVTRVDTSDCGGFPGIEPFELRDDPPFSPLCFVAARMRLWAAMRDAGFKGFVDGDGGDEIFSTMQSPRNALRDGDWLTLLRHLRGRPDWQATVWRALVLPYVPDRVRALWFRRWKRRSHPGPGYLTWGATEARAIEEAVEYYHRRLVHPEYATLLHDWLSTPEVVASVQAHRQLARAFGLDIVSPLVDRRMLALALTLPQDLVLSAGYESKAFLRHASVDRLPEEIRLHPKDLRRSDLFARSLIVSSGARQILRDPQVRRRLSDWVQFDRLDATLDEMARGWQAPVALSSQIERLVSFAEWYARAHREYGVD